MKIFGFAVSLVLFLAGFYLMATAFSISEFQLPVFFAGIISSSLGLFIPVHVMKRVDG